MKNLLFSVGLPFLVNALTARAEEPEEPEEATPNVAKVCLKKSGGHARFTMEKDDDLSLSKIWYDAFGEYDYDQNDAFAWVWGEFGEPNAVCPSGFDTAEWIETEDDDGEIDFVLDNDCNDEWDNNGSGFIECPDGFEPYYDDDMLLGEELSDGCIEDLELGSGINIKVLHKKTDENCEDGTVYHVYDDSWKVACGTYDDVTYTCPTGFECSTPEDEQGVCGEATIVEPNEVCDDDGKVCYTVNGAQKMNDECKITFVNFGIKKNISNIQVKNGSTLKINNLINGNIGPNNANSNVNYNNADTLKNNGAISIKQNGEDIDDDKFVITITKKGYINLEISDLSSCEGLTVKQNIIEETVQVARRVYYNKQVPGEINKSFSVNYFGPSHSYGFKRYHWKINQGLDSLRTKCGIHILYTSMTSSNKDHWQYYLSKENINSEECTDDMFYDALLNLNDSESNFTDADDDISVSNYMGYVMKREGHVEEHMDGIIPNVEEFFTEIYQEEKEDGLCPKYYICNFSADARLPLKHFAAEIVNNCLNIGSEDSLRDECVPKNDFESSTGGITTNEKSTPKTDRITKIKLNSGNIITVKPLSSDGKGHLPQYCYEDITQDKTLIFNTQISDSLNVRVSRFTIEIDCSGDSTKSYCNVCPANN